MGVDMYIGHAEEGRGKNEGKRNAA